MVGTLCMVLVIHAGMFGIISWHVLAVHPGMFWEYMLACIDGTCRDVFVLGCGKNLKS